MPKAKAGAELSHLEDLALLSFGLSGRTEDYSLLARPSNDDGYAISPRPPLDLSSTSPRSPPRVERPMSHRP